MLFGGGLLAVFGSEAIELGGAGPLAVITAAFVSCYFWQQEGWEVDDVSIVALQFCLISREGKLTTENSHVTVPRLVDKT